jgi:hypothetical protein
MISRGAEAPPCALAWLYSGCWTLAMRADPCLRSQGPQTTIINPEDDSEKDFAFDYSYWSHDGFITEEDGYNTAGGPASKYGSEYASQKDVYEHLGLKMLENAWQVSSRGRSPHALTPNRYGTRFLSCTRSIVRASPLRAGLQLHHVRIWPDRGW